MAGAPRVRSALTTIQDALADAEAMEMRVATLEAALKEKEQEAKEYNEAAVRWRSVARQNAKELREMRKMNSGLIRKMHSLTSEKLEDVAATPPGERRKRKQASVAATPEGVDGAAENLVERRSDGADGGAAAVALTTPAPPTATKLAPKTVLRAAPPLPFASPPAPTRSPPRPGPPPLPTTAALDALPAPVTQTPGSPTTSLDKHGGPLRGSPPRDGGVGSPKRRRKEAEAPAEAAAPPKPARFNAVVRGRAERAALNGFACADCKRFYEASGINLECRHNEPKRAGARAVPTVNGVSRHRARHAPPADPVGYWDLMPADMELTHTPPA